VLTGGVSTGGVSNGGAVRGGAAKGGSGGVSNGGALTGGVSKGGALRIPAETVAMLTVKVMSNNTVIIAFLFIFFHSPLAGFYRDIAS
jgi:hypothetical protein